VTGAARRGAEALARLDETTRLLRRECPWDREQDERSIVPHTIEEAYELADAAQRGDDVRLLDELGDVLFQVLFLSLLLEERGAGDLGAVAEGCREKLIRRHPHVFGEVSVSDADDVRRNWDEIKRGEAGRDPSLFGDIPDTLPGPLYAAKALRRANDARAPDVRAAVEALDGSFDAVGDLLLAAVAAARERGVDPELSLRSAADRYRRRIEQEVGSRSE
jgi:uncharacterized protein YabN with tetrapyrrole methylase and pyrophosphatase domain